MSLSKESELIIESQEPQSNSTSFKSKLLAIKNNFTKFVIIKLCVVIVIVTLMTFLSIYGMGMPTSMNGKCIIDRGFTITNTINKFFQDNLIFRNTLLIIAGLLIDFVFLSVCINWSLFTKSWRIFITLGLFYGIRGITQTFFQMSFPDGFTWEYPGFPSLVVSYLKTNDFFFSGHCGMPMICHMEFKAEKKMIMSYFCLFVMFFEAFIVLISRIHYTIDIFIGMFFAQYLFILIDHLCNWIGAKRSKKVKAKEDIEKLEPIHQDNIIAGN